MKNISSKAIALSFVFYLCAVISSSLYLVFVFAYFWSNNIYVRNLGFESTSLPSLENLMSFDFACLVLNSAIIFMTGITQRLVQRNRRRRSLFILSILLIAINLLSFDASSEKISLSILNLIMIYPVLYLGFQSKIIEALTLRKNEDCQLLSEKIIGVITGISIPFISFFLINANMNISILIVLSFISLPFIILTIMLHFYVIQGKLLFIFIMLWLICYIPFLIFNWLTCLLLLGPISFIIRTHSARAGG